MTEASMIKKMKRAQLIADRLPAGTSQHTRAVNNYNRWRRQLACLRAEGSMKNWMNYE